MTGVVVLAYDGHVIESLDARTLAVVEAMHAEGIAIESSNVRACIAGRSMPEAVHAAALRFAPNADATSLDLAALRADRAFSAAAARGLPLCHDAAQFIQRTAANSPIFLRADSRRHDVATVLSMTHLESFFAFVRCADDGGLRTLASDDHTLRSLAVAYSQIATRLAARSIAPSACIVYETSEHAMEIARAHGFTVATHAVRAS